MAQGNRSKEVWLIPKRVNLHQTICLIEGIIDRNYSGTVWNSQKQDNLGVNLKRRGATNSGKNISQQALRTLVASVPQYLGYLYINSNTTPNTICLTKAGKELFRYHKNDLVTIKNLRDNQEKLIVESPLVLKQMEKLQITNPIIKKDCENILLYPFRMTLRLLLDLNYLDREELAYIVFQIKDETEYNLAITQINSLRSLEFTERKKIIDAFKETHIGNITLVQAPSSSYYESLCKMTGIIEKCKVIYPNENNGNKKVNAIRIKDGFEDRVKNILSLEHNNSQVYDFKDNLNLWIEYIGNTDRLEPPRNIKLKNKSNKDIIICLYKEGNFLEGDLIKKDSYMEYPMFLNEKYEIDYVNAQTGKSINRESFTPTSNMIEVEFEINEDFSEIGELSIEERCEEITEHSTSKKFGKKILNYLEILSKIDGIDRREFKHLKGAYYEYLFFELLLELQKDAVIDEVIWNGKIGEYGLPVSAPGGKTGTCDIIFKIDDTDFVLELTTIRAKSIQWSAEGASVPDHIKLYSQSTERNVVGIFCAPQIHERNKNIMNAVLNDLDIHLNNLTDNELLKLFKSKNRNLIYSKLNCLV